MPACVIKNHKTIILLPKISEKSASIINRKTGIILKVIYKNEHIIRFNVFYCYFLYSNS